MLITALFILLTAVALPSLQISCASSIRICSIVFISSIALSYNAQNNLGLEMGVNIYNGLIQVTSTSYIVDVLLGIIGAFALTPWASYAVGSRVSMGQSSDTLFTLVPTSPYFTLLVLFSVCGGSFLASSASLVCVYLSVELQSFAVYVLATLYRDSESSTNAGLMYFLLGGLSSCLILLGSAEVFAHLGVSNFESFYALLSVGESSSFNPISLGMTLLASGLLFKVAAAPFHNWAPDVYDRVPTIVTVWISTMPKLAVLGLIYELYEGLSLDSDSLVVSLGNISYNTWTNTITIVALVSLVLGSLIGLAQTRIKRLLAYSTVSHVGFMLLALTAYNANTSTLFFFYLAQYSITGLAALIIVLAFGYLLWTNGTSTRVGNNTTDIELLSELSGQITQYPILSLGFAILLFSIAGVPPLVGFWAKQGVLEATVMSNYGGIALLGVLASVVSAVYYLKVVWIMNFDTVSSNSVQNTTQKVRLTSMHTFGISLFIMIVTFYMAAPSSFLDSTRSMALSSFMT